MMTSIQKMSSMSFEVFNLDYAVATNCLFFATPLGFFWLSFFHFFVVLIGTFLSFCSYVYSNDTKHCDALHTDEVLVWGDQPWDLPVDRDTDGVCDISA
jgi:hypothetical protein